MEVESLNREAIVDMMGVVEELRDRIEALELASDPVFMDSLRKSGEEIKNGELVEFDDL